VFFSLFQQTLANLSPVVVLVCHTSPVCGEKEVTKITLARVTYILTCAYAWLFLFVIFVGRPTMLYTMTLDISTIISLHKKFK
jgi:hypothetical protein